MKEKLTIIDTTSLMWTACVTLGDDKDNYIKAKKNFDKWFEDILNQTKTDYYLAFTDQSSFRRELLHDYKSDRASERPKFLKPLMKDVSEKWNIFSNPIIESDDLCLINHNHYKDKYDCVIAAIDSDLRQYPAKFYNYKKNKAEGKSDWEEVTPGEAELNLWTSVIAGSHNGLKGIHGCGESNARMYLTKFKPAQFPFAALSAYIKGVDKTKYKGMTRNIKGLGLFKGQLEYNRNFISSYLLRTEEEGLKITNDKLVIEPIKNNDIKELEW